MKLGTYRYGESKRQSGLAVGVARHLPRGVRKGDYAKRGFFDVWMPVLAPSRGLVADYLGRRIPFATFARRYRAEMRVPAARHSIQLIAAMAQRWRINLGCYCADGTHCHRSVLQKLVAEAAAELPKA